MGKQNVVHGKVQDQGSGKFKVDKGNQPDEADVEIDMGPAGSYDVEKLEVNGLPDRIDGKKIRWFNNFSIKHKGGEHVKQTYRVTIAGLQQKLKEKNSKLVIYSEMHDPKLYYLEPAPEGDWFNLDDGDPGTGQSP